MTKYLTKISCYALCAFLVGCGGGNSKKSTDNLVVNLAPTAEITLSKSEVAELEVVEISAKNSRDPEGQNLTYLWTITDSQGAEFSLNNPNAEEITFSAENFGQYNVELTVTDNGDKTDSIDTALTVIPSNDDYPTAKINSNNVSKIGNTVWLNGDESLGAHGQLISYQWEITNKPTGSDSALEQAMQATAYFTPDVKGEYVVLLTVKNQNDLLTSAHEIKIIAEELIVNTPPVAQVSQNATEVKLGDIVKFDGSNSYDLDNDPLTYTWQWTKKPAGSQAQLEITDNYYAQFMADLEGEYAVKLIVKDTEFEDEVSATVLATVGNTAPIADAGDDFDAVLDLEIELDASRSSDAEQQDLQYEWRLTSRPAHSRYNEFARVELRDYHKVTISPDVVGAYTFSLRVFDGLVYSEPDSVTVNVLENQRPVAVLPASFVTSDSDLILIDGSSSFDAESQHLTYHWSLTHGPEDFDGELVVLDNMAQLTPTHLGNYSIQLVVNDGTQDSHPAYMVIARESEEVYTREVSGRLVDSGGNPVENVKISGVFQPTSTSNAEGEFNLTLTSQEVDARLTMMTINIDDQIRATMRLPDYTEEILELGDVTIPVMQRKDVTLSSCEGYTGEETLELLFVQRNDGYENATFWQGVYATLTVGEQPKVVNLPATGVIEIRVTQSSSTATLENGQNYFTHEYQLDDSQQDLLSLTVCN